MTEPTAEQVNEQRERAHEVVGEIPCIYAFPDKHNFTCTSIATALARVRIEAHSAGLDEGLDQAIAAIHAECLLTLGRECRCGAMAKAIRALRGRT